MPETRPTPERGAGSTWIGKDTLLDGKITTREDICIQGRLKGSVESSASVLVPQGGEVEADIVARSVAIHGRVAGNVEAVETAEIGESGTLVGGILASIVSIKAGATFEGTVQTRAREPAGPGEPEDPE